MARLSRALIDRARIVRQVAAGPRVEGASPMAATYGDWFPCRLVIRDAREDPHGGRRAVTARGQIVCPPGADVLASDQVEIRSPLLGDGRWQVVAAPERATTGRAVKALLIDVERVTEPTRDSVLA